MIVPRRSNETVDQGKQVDLLRRKDRLTLHDGTVNGRTYMIGGERRPGTTAFSAKPSHQLKTEMWSRSAYIPDALLDQGNPSLHAAFQLGEG